MSQPRHPKCPKCGEESAIICNGRRYALYPSGCVAVLGLPIALFHQASCPTDYECQSCNTKFGVRSLFAKCFLWLILLLVLLLVITSFFN